MPKSVSLGTVHVALEMRLQKFNEGVTQSKKAMAQMEKDFGAHARKIGDSFKDIGRDLSIGVTAPLVLFGRASIQTATRMDSLRRSLTSLTGSAEETERQLARLREAAKLPGLGFTELIEGTVRLQSAGLSAQQAERALKGFGNAVAIAGGSKEDLREVGVQLAQIASSGKLQGDELRIIAERVPQVRAVLKEAFGTASSEEISKFGLSVEQILSAITTGLEKLPQATDSVQNKFDNLNDTIDDLKRAVGEAFLPAVTEGLGKIAKAAEDATKWFKDLEPAAQQGLGQIAVILAATGPVMLALGGFASLVGKIASNPFFKWLTKIAPGGAGAVGASVVIGDLLSRGPGAGQRQNERASVIGQTWGLVPGFVPPAVPTNFIPFGQFDRFRGRTPNMGPLGNVPPPSQFGRALLGDQFVWDPLTMKWLPSGVSPSAKTKRRDFQAEAKAREEAEKRAKEAKERAERARRADIELRAELEGPIAQARLQARDMIGAGQNQKDVRRWLFVEEFRLRQQATERLRHKAEQEITAVKGWLAAQNKLDELVADAARKRRDTNYAIKEAARTLGLEQTFIGGGPERPRPPLAGEPFWTPEMAKKRAIEAMSLGSSIGEQGKSIASSVEHLAKNVKRKAKPAIKQMSFDIGKEFGDNLGIEVGRAFGEMFAKVFGSGNPLSRALSNTLSRLVDEIVYGLIQKAFGQRLILSIFGGGALGGGMTGTGASLAGGVAGGAMFGKLGMGSAAKGAGAKAGTMFGTQFALNALAVIGATMGAASILRGIFRGSAQGRANLNRMYSLDPGFAATGTGTGGARFTGVPYFNVNFYGSRFAGGMDVQRTAESLAWHTQQKLRSRA